MEGLESALLRNDKNLGLRFYGGRFFQAAYMVRSEANGMSNVFLQFEKELAYMLISIFEHFLRRRIHENDVTVLLGQLVNDSHKEIMDGVNIAREIQFQEIQNALSPESRPTIEQSLSQTVEQVRLTVWKMLAILGAKGGDAALAHIDRLRRELLQKFSEQEKLLAQAEAGQKRMTKLLQDFLARSGTHTKSLRDTIGNLQGELKALGIHNTSLQQNLQRNVQLLQGSRLQVERLQGQYDGLLPRVNAYIAIEKSLSRAQMTLSGKTIAEKVERLLGELQRLQEVEAGKNNTASRLMQTE